MKKLFSFLSIFFISVFCLYSQTLTIGNITYQVDTLANLQIGPGTRYVSLSLTTNTPTSANQRVFFLKTDLRNEHIEIRQVLSRDSLIGNEITPREARRRNTPEAFYFAGINADFFGGATPVGGNIANSEIGRIPNDRAVFAIDEDGIPDTGFMSYSGSLTFGGNTHSITSVNLTRGTNALVLYNQLNGRFTRTNEHGTEVLVELLPNYTWGINRTLRARVLEIEKGRGSMRIPPGQAVLSGHGTSRDILNELSIDDEVEINFELVMNGNAWHWAQMTGGGCEGFCRILLDNGVVETDYPATAWHGRQPRTGIGFSQDRNTLIMAVVDGRHGTTSTGVTLPHFAEIMKSAGAWMAVNLDGGGSSTLFAEPFGIMNRPADAGIPRPVTNHIFIVSTAPEDNNIDSIASHTPVLELPVFGEFTPRFFGYNQFGLILNADLQNVVLSVSPSLGTVIGNKFVAGGSGESGVITATYNGATTEIQVNIIPALGIALRLDSIVLDNRTDYTIEVLATTARGDIPISPLAFHWTAENNEILEIVDGSIRALSNGRTIVSGTLDGTTVELIVNVELPDAPVMKSANTELANWSMEVVTHYRNDARLNEENLPPSWEHGIAVNFIHRAGRTPFIRLINEIPLFGLPDTVRIVMNVGETIINSANVFFRPNYENRRVVSLVDDFPMNQDFSIAIAMADLFDTSDRAIYPIWFDNINFQTSPSANEPGRAYTIALKEIQLVYAGFVQTSIPFVRDSSFPHFFIFPNPTVDRVLHLQLSENNSQTVRTEIFNLQGQLVMQEFHGTNSGAPIQLSIQHLPAGAYLIQVFENERSAGTMQFIVK